MAKKPLPSPEELRQLLRYDPETGKLFWRERSREWFNSDARHAGWNKRRAGREAMTYTDTLGYKSGGVDRHQVRAHRVIWALHYGEWPDGVIDHINSVKTDNRLCNLRCASVAQNTMNRRPTIGTSAYKGVHLSKAGSWCAMLQKDRKRKYLGRFKTEVEAAQAYDNAARAEFGDYAKLNLIG